MISNNHEIIYSCKQMLKKLLFYPFLAVLSNFYLFLYGSCSPRITAHGQTTTISATTKLLHLHQGTFYLEESS